MALIKCPECGHVVSDKAIKCPQCAYPIRKLMTKNKSNHTNRMSNPSTMMSFSLPKAFVPSVVEHIKNKATKKILGNFAIGIGIVCCVLLGINYFTNQVSVESIDLKKWKVIDSTDYGNTYEGTVESNERKPFVAVIGSYEEDNAVPDFVYMENGLGILQTYESSEEDPSTYYKPIGYIPGNMVTESSFKSIEYHDYDYYDFDYLGYTRCYVDIAIEMKGNPTGLLFFELKNDLTGEVECNKSAVVIDGIGKSTIYLSELPLKSRGIDIILTPKYFCPASKLQDSDYSVERAFSVDKEEGTYSTNFSGSMELQFDDYEDGFVLYTRELTLGGAKEDRNKVFFCKAFAHEKFCTVTTYDSCDKDEVMLTPQYKFDIAGYLTWRKLK